MNRHSILISEQDHPLKRAPSTQMKCGECATKVTRIRLLCDYPLSRRASLILSCLLQFLILSAPSFHLVCSNSSPCLLHLFIKPKPNLTFNIRMSSAHQTLHKYPVEWPTTLYNKGRQFIFFFCFDNTVCALTSEIATRVTELYDDFRTDG